MPSVDVVQPATPPTTPDALRPGAVGAERRMFHSMCLIEAES